LGGQVHKQTSDGDRRGFEKASLENLRRIRGRESAEGYLGKGGEPERGFNR